MNDPFAADVLADFLRHYVKPDMVVADPTVPDGAVYLVAPDALELKPIGGELRDSIVKLSAVVPVSNELLNPAPPSDEDVARWRAEREARETREDARHAQLLAAGGVVAAVAGLHSPDDARDCKECQDGDFMSAWPCTTWNLLDEQAPR